MTGKIMGAVLIISACGIFGFSTAASYRKEERALQQLIGALDFMQCELQYRLTPLPDLCRQAGAEQNGCIGSILTRLSRELEAQISPDVESCVNSALYPADLVPDRVIRAFQIMGTSLGRFDVEGQVKGLEAVRSFCRSELEAMAVNRDSRLRSYQTLGLCAGAALAILFV